MGLLFGSVGAHTCQESRQVPPPPPSFRRAEFSHINTSNIFCNIISWHTGFLPGISFRGEVISIVFGPSFRESKSLRRGQKAWGGALAHCGRTPSPVNSEFLPNSIQLPHFKILPVLEGFFFTSLVPDIFGILAIFDHRVHTKVVNWNL